MGKGQRHSKNAGSMGVEGMTHHERKALGFGTVKQRLGKESQGNYYDCCLTLQPAVDPVVTPDGYLFSREAIVENLLQQKKLIKRKIAAWEEQQREEEQQAAERAAYAEEARLIAFDRQNHKGISEQTAKSIESAIVAEASTLHEDKGAKAVVAIKEHEARIKGLKAFWMPQLAPTTKATLEKPSGDTFCPTSGMKLRLKDLTPVHFTPVNAGDSGRYMDPISRDTFTNSSKLVVLRTTGDVMLEETYNKCVKPDGVYDGKRIKERDVVVLKGGGTGFAARDGEKLQAKKHFALGPGSGKADLRGQHQGPRSMGGLVFNN